MPARSTPHNNRKTVPLWLFLGMFPVLLGAGAVCVLWYWDTHKDAIIRKKIETALNDKSKGLYNIKYDSTGMDELEGNLSFYNIHLDFDPVKYQAAERKGIAPPILFTVDIPEISVSGIRTSRAMSNSEIVGQKLTIKNPVIDLRYTYQGKDAENNMPTQEVYKEILGGLKLVQVDTVLLSNATIRRMNGKTGQVMTEGKNINITLIDLKIDSAAFEDKSRMMFSKSVNINVGNIKWASGNKLYNFTVGNISLNSANNTMNVGRFDMKPLLGEEAFVNARPYQEDRLDVSFSGISFTGVDAKKLLGSEIQAETMVIGSASVKSYRDLAKPRDHKNRVGHYPQQELASIPVPISIKKIVLNDSYIECRERNQATRKTGKVSFDHLNAVISNFTNNKKAQGEQMNMTVNCRLLDLTSFSSRWTFYLLHPKGRFDVSGTVGSLEGPLLNPLIQASAPAYIREGKLNGMEFNLQGDDHGVSGNMKFLYENLKIDVMEKDIAGVKGNKKFLTSFAANIIIKNSNPKKNEAIRQAKVSMTRDPNRSIFWLCWKTIFKGIRETVGIKQAQGQP